MKPLTLTPILAVSDTAEHTCNNVLLGEFKNSSQKTARLKVLEARQLGRISPHKLSSSLGGCGEGKKKGGGGVANEQIEHCLFILKGMGCEKLLDQLLWRKKNLCFNITKHSNVAKTHCILSLINPP